MSGDWLLAEGRTVRETAELTGFVPRWVDELLVRYNWLGPGSLGDRRRGNGARPTVLTPDVLAMLCEGGKDGIVGGAVDPHRRPREGGASFR